MVKCPLHEDKTPSCSIDTGDSLWKCHSCGKGGDAYTLIMEMEKCDFVRARAFAASLGLPTGGAGRGGVELSGSAYGGRRRLPARKGNQPRGSGYTPSWRRR
ncbi:CHC2 zinc finger domain-containing protein [Actinoplanes campanulatus]|uniref:CHC2 zinc finger domain-containing protein n=1 Tax=Actinoplanes campanulatus TaxID=113559 RepID=UPI0035585233